MTTLLSITVIVRNILMVALGIEGTVLGAAKLEGCEDNMRYMKGSGIA